MAVYIVNNFDHIPYSDTLYVRMGTISGLDDETVKRGRSRPLDVRYHPLRSNLHFGLQ
jgi:hypothetical protein